MGGARTEAKDGSAFSAPPGFSDLRVHEGTIEVEDNNATWRRFKEHMSEIV